MHRAAGVLVGVSAVCPGRRPLPEDLRAAAALRALPGDSCPAAGVRAGLAAGRGRGDRDGDRRGGRRCGAGLPGWRSLIRRRGGGHGGSPPPFRSSGSRSRRWQSSSAGKAVRPPADPGRFALTAIAAAVLGATQMRSANRSLGRGIPKIPAVRARTACSRRTGRGRMGLRLRPCLGPGCGPAAGRHRQLSAAPPRRRRLRRRRRRPPHNHPPRPSPADGTQRHCQPKTVAFPS